MNSNKRLLSLDILRGLTVAGMILVNNGAGHEHFEPLTHSAWNGLTPCDLVFPFFLFIVGVCIPMSSKTDLRQVFWRSVKMFAIGVALHAWDMWIGGKEDILAHLRIWGVLERIALCYLAACIIHRYVKKAPYLLLISACILVAYATVLLLFNGYAQDESNIASIIDRALLGKEHLYQKSPIDPEGLLGTVSATAHTLLGVFIGRLLKHEKKSNPHFSTLVTYGFLFLCVGIAIMFKWHKGSEPLLPLNKRIWSPSYVLVTCGLATLLLSLLKYIIDNRDWKQWCRPFLWFGTNAIVLYVASEMLSPLMWKTGIAGTIYEGLLSMGCCAKVASLGYALTFDVLMGLIAWILFKLKIFIKL